ncbi:DNAJ protein JJJ1 homolog [Argentina anserina]|uniref:DNAJ protein JJJ1 homolog n=1 Tax=Argentina anserina TaxID=57926 RepID=UPI0021768490|nr:DNAJ protein JJJ1 homolog [Potentilla anserina]
MKRADYDLYRKKNATPESFKLDLVLNKALRFSSYSDEGRGFFKVYGDVFEKIYANEVAFQELKLPPDSVVKPPEIGDEHGSYLVVAQFYNYWLNFVTIMDFRWVDPHDKYDLAAAQTKKGLGIMTRKNMKARKKAKRVEEMEEEKERRTKVKKEKMERALEYEEPEWTRPVERKRKYGVEEKEEEKEREEWECVVCRKEFKSEKQCLNHQMSKRRRSVKSTRANEVHIDKPESKSDSGADFSCVDNGSEDRKRKKGRKKEKRSERNSKRNGESEDSGIKNSKSGGRIKYGGKKSRADICKKH